MCGVLVGLWFTLRVRVSSCVVIRVGIREVLKGLRGICTVCINGEVR